MPSKSIIPLVLDSIGTYGLNSQSSPSALDHQWLTAANNIMLDDRGRITYRQGIKQLTTTIGSSTSNSHIVKSIGEYKTASGTSVLFSGAYDKIYKIDTGTTPNLLTAQSFTGTPQTITDGNWEFANFNDNFYGVQAGHKPIHYDGTDWMDLEDTSGFTYPTGLNTSTFNPSCILGSFGRLWVGGTSGTNDVVYYSDTLIGHKFTTGASGYLDLKTVWTGDEVVALSSFMGKLVIFGKKNIAIYNEPWDPSVSAFQLEEVIEGVGCVARDSVQALGDDIIFLSNSGLRSLQRTQIQDKMPLTDISKNIKDELVNHIVNADMDKVKAQYCLCGGYYALAFPDKNVVYVFDFKGINPDQTPRITTWNFEDKKMPKSFLSTTEGIMYIGGGHATYKGRVGTYTEYFDVEKNDVTSTYGTETPCDAAGHTWESTDSKCWETVNGTYQGAFKTVWLDFGDPSRAKLLKRFLAVISGGKDMAVTMNWFRDYEVRGDSSSFTLSPTTSGTSYIWGASTSIYGTTTVTTTAATALVTDTYYAIETVGTSNFVLAGASVNVVGTVFKATGTTTGTGTVVSHTHTAALHAASSKYAGTFQPKEYRLSLAKSAKVLRMEMVGTINGFKASLQNMIIWAKQGKIR